jgi:hypothetical protein
MIQGQGLTGTGFETSFFVLLCVPLPCFLLLLCVVWTGDGDDIGTK